MFRLSNKIGELSSGELYQKYSQPNVEPFECINGKPLPNGVPPHGVIPIWLGKGSELVALSEAKIFVTDFGKSYLPSITPRHYSSTPDFLAPPETYFHKNLSFPSDIWTLACTLVEILGQRALFEAYNASDDWVIKEHVDALGKLPCDWWHEWAARGHWFTEDAKRKSEDKSRSFMERFVDSIQDPRQETMDSLEEAEKSALLTMLRGMLTFRPNERLTASEVVESEWMQKWALPVLKESSKI